MKQVLIVDDSEQIRERLVTLLSESDQISITGQAGNARDALIAVQHLKPDTVVLDIRLPGRSGIELLKEIKERYPDIVVIMLTNYDYVQYRQQCRQLGANHFLNKTFEFEKIVETILTTEGAAGDGDC